uniref:Receptor for retinol uptake STRA6 n=1 Tax=Scleropages formosus TaxID=113540 RepID=A0A8C9RGN9_SCLFO
MMSSKWEEKGLRVLFSGEDDPLRTSMDLEIHCKEFNNWHYWLVPAAVYTVLVSFLQKRKTQCVLDYKLSLNQRFGMPLPFKLLSTHSNRWGFALAFGAIANVLLHTTVEVIRCLHFTPNVWAEVLVLLLMSVEVAVIHYPMFICMSVENKAVGSFLGLIYSLAWFLYQVLLTSSLQTEIPHIESSRPPPVPSLICCSLLVLRYFYSFFKEVCMCQTHRSDDQSHRCEIPLHNIKYVKCLLQPSSPVVKPLFFRLLYDWDPCFCFPAGMITMAVLSLIGVYTILMKFLLWNNYIKDWFQGANFDEHFHIFGVIAVLLTAIVSVYHIFTIMVKYRAQMKRLYKGDRTGLPKKFPATDDIMVRSIAYIGTQVAALMSSVAVIYLLFLAGVVAFYWIIVVPLQQKRAHEVYTLLGNILGNIIPLVALFLILKATMYRFFLQEKLSQRDQQKPLALKNLRALENLRLSDHGPH